MSLLRIVEYEGYQILDSQGSVRDKTLKIILETLDTKPMVCYRCEEKLTHLRGKYRMSCAELNVMDSKVTVYF